MYQEERDEEDLTAKKMLHVHQYEDLRTPVKRDPND